MSLCPDRTAHHAGTHEQATQYHRCHQPGDLDLWAGKWAENYAPLVKALHHSETPVSDARARN